MLLGGLPSQTAGRKEGKNVTHAHLEAWCYVDTYFFCFTEYLKGFIKLSFYSRHAQTPPSHEERGLVIIEQFLGCAHPEAWCYVDTYLLSVSHWGIP